MNKYEDIIKGKNEIIKSLDIYNKKYKNKLVILPNGFKGRIVGYSLVDSNLLCITDSYTMDHKEYNLTKDLKKYYEYGNFVYLENVVFSRDIKWLIIPLPLINITLEEF